MKDFRVYSLEGPEPTSLTLLAKVRDGKDRAAWERFVSLYAPLVYHWCRQAGLQQADVEEVGQEVFLAVSRAIGRFRRDRKGDTFRGWLRTITRRKVLDHRAPPGGRGAGGTDAQHLLGEVADGTPGGDDEALENRAAEDRILCRRAVELVESAFEPATRQAFWLLISGHKAAEVASQLGVTPGAVYTAKSRVLKRLREEFGDLIELCPPGPA